jgi:hypothetical protein
MLLPPLPLPPSHASPREMSGPSDTQRQQISALLQQARLILAPGASALAPSPEQVKAAFEVGGVAPSWCHRAGPQQQPHDGSFD